MMARRAALLGLALDHAQAMLVLEALGEMPWRLVQALIGRLQRWGNQAFGAARTGAPQPFALAVHELELIIEALGEMPHRRVYALIASLQGQLDQLGQGQLTGCVANG